MKKKIAIALLTFLLLGSILANILLVFSSFADFDHSRTQNRIHTQERKGDLEALQSIRPHLSDTNALQRIDEMIRAKQLRTR